MGVGFVFAVTELNELGQSFTPKARTGGSIHWPAGGAGDKLLLSRVEFHLKGDQETDSVNSLEANLLHVSPDHRP